MKRRHHHGALRQALVQAGLDLLDSEGSEGVTIRAVARAAGVSHAAPVNHFPDRRALLTGIAIACFEQLQAAVAGGDWQAAPTPRARLHGLASVLVGYGLANPHRYRLMWRQDLLNAGDSALKALTDGVFELVGEALGDFAEPAAISRMSRVVALCAALHGYVLLRIDGGFDTFDDELTGLPRYLAVVDSMLPG
jgi:AcrR family transcriptional regulator